MNKPELRFPEFSEEWEREFLGNLLTFKNGINASKEKYGKGVKFINVLDIINNNFIKYDNIIGLVEVSEKEIKNNQVSYGDILFQRSSETREEVGQTNVYLDKEKDAVFGGFVIRGKKNADYNPLFMNYLLKTSKARKEITSKSGGSTRYNVGQETLRTVVITLPTLPEQTKIANFLSAVDKRIENGKLIIDNLKLYKRGLMQQIFSQKLRFKDKNGQNFPDWEEKRLGDLTNITTGKLDANAMKDNGIYRFYTCAEEFYFIDKYAFDTEALLISGNGANVGYIHYYKGKFNAYQRTYVLDSFSENIIYIKYFLGRHLRKRIMRERNEGNTPYIVLGTLSNFKIQLPSLPEQKKIANFLSALDRKIENAEKKLEHLKEWKKGLLQKMFV